MSGEFALQLFEINQQLARRLVTRVLILGQNATHDLLEFLWRARDQVPNWRGIVISDGHHHVMQRLAAERTLSADELVENHAQAEEIASAIKFLSANLLWRHVTGRAQKYSGPGFETCRYSRIAGAVICQFLFSQLRQPKVEHLGVAIGPEHDVFRFDVAVNYSGGMRGA